MTENPEHAVTSYVDDIGLGQAPAEWRERIKTFITEHTPSHPDGSTDQRVRFLLGLAMIDLRGKVPAAEVEAAIRTEIGANDD